MNEKKKQQWQRNSKNNKVLGFSTSMKIWYIYMHNRKYIFKTFSDDDTYSDMREYRRAAVVDVFVFSWILFLFLSPCVRNVSSVCACVFETNSRNWFKFIVKVVITAHTQTLHCRTYEYMNAILCFSINIVIVNVYNIAVLSALSLSSTLSLSVFHVRLCVYVQIDQRKKKLLYATKKYWKIFLGARTTSSFFVWIDSVWLGLSLVVFFYVS